MTDHVEVTQADEFVRMVARLEHTGDEGFVHSDDHDDDRGAMDSLIATARDITAAPCTEAERARPWKTWHGGDDQGPNELDIEERVEVERRGPDARCYRVDERHHIDWKHTSGPEDVMRYRRIDAALANEQPALAKAQEVEYGDWKIYFDPPPIPTRNCDWHFCHKDFDGAPDSNDNRCGYGASVLDCINQIIEMEEDEHPAQSVPEAVWEAVYRVWDKVRGTNADLCQTPRRAYQICVEAARKELDAIDRESAQSEQPDDGLVEGDPFLIIDHVPTYHGQTDGTGVVFCRCGIVFHGDDRKAAEAGWAVHVRGRMAANKDALRAQQGEG